MFKKVNKTETVISSNSILDSNIKTKDDLKIFGKVNGSIESEGNVTIAETGVVLGKVNSKNLLLEGTVEGDVNCINSLKLASSAKLSGNAYVKTFSVEEGSMFTGKCIMSGMDNLLKRAKRINENFDMAMPTSPVKATIISELENTETKKARKKRVAKVKTEEEPKN